LLVTERIVMKKAMAFLALLAFGVTACGGGGGDPGGDVPVDTVQRGEDTTAPPADTEVPEDTPPGVDTYVPLPDEYPQPPYGKAVDTVIADHHFLIPGENTIVKLSDYYLHDSRKILLINASAGWCSACKQEAIELNNTFAEYGPQGFDILFTLFEDWNGGPVSAEFFDAWMDQYGGDYATVLDPEFELGVYFNVEATPMNMLVDLETMTIVWLETGFNPVALEAKLDELLVH